MYINGDWVSTTKTLNVTNPGTNEVFMKVNKSGEIETELAITAADNALNEWANLPAIKRAQYLEKVALKLKDNYERLAKIISNEMGKPIKNARSEVDSAISFLKWYAEEGRRAYGETIPSSHSNKRLMTVKQPIGVVAAITPWNFPLSMAVKKIAPALAAGCTVVLRPSSQAPISAIELMKIFNECNVPNGVVNLVIGDASEITKTIMSSKVVRKITFTGSTEVGKMLMKEASNTVKRVSMELGGHAPLIVYEDADIDLAIEGAIQAKYSSSGQQCVCANRIFVHEKIYDDFETKFVKKVSDLKIGMGIEESTDIGPLISKNAISNMQLFVDDAVSKGAKILLGGNQLNEGIYKKGHFYSPTVLSNVTNDMRILKEETFGPIAPIIRFSSEDEVIKAANDIEFGLAAYFYTNDLSKMYRTYEKLDYGVIGVNDARPSIVQGPFGGLKESGIGREGGKGINDYLEVKFVSIQIKN